MLAFSMFALAFLSMSLLVALEWRKRHGKSVGEKPKQKQMQTSGIDCHWQWVVLGGFDGLRGRHID